MQGRALAHPCIGYILCYFMVSVLTETHFPASTL